MRRRKWREQSALTYSAGTRRDELWRRCAIRFRDLRFLAGQIDSIECHPAALWRPSRTRPGAEVT